MTFRFTLTLDMEKPGADLSARDRVTIQVQYEHGRWRGLCERPAVSTLLCESLDEAIATTAKEIAAEWSRESRAAPELPVSL